MGRMSRWALSGLVAAAMAIGGLTGLAGTATASPPSSQSQGGRPVLHQALTPSTPTGPEIFTVTPGNVPWSIAAGHVLLQQNGTLQVDVARLIDPTVGHNPVPYLAASVYCSGTEVATTTYVPFSYQGNARLRATVTMPSACAAPAVLIRPAKPITTVVTVLPAYIAFTAQA